MKISGLLRQTLIDYSTKLACEIFSAGCNYNCPSCHSKHIIHGDSDYSEKEIFDYLDRGRGFIDGVVICGGEPTIQNDLPEFISEIKKYNVAVKLDTNGSNPKMLNNLLDKKIVDYVAMDVKGPKHLYSQLIGRNGLRFSFGDIETSIKLVSQFPGHEFRTTIVPVARKSNKFGFLAPNEIGETAKWIFEITQNNTHRYYLQKFVARSKQEMLNEKFCRENLPAKLCETPINLMQKMKEQAIEYLPNCLIRNG